MVTRTLTPCMIIFPDSGYIIGTDDRSEGQNSNTDSWPAEWRRTDSHGGNGLQKAQELNFLAKRVDQKYFNKNYCNLNIYLLFPCVPREITEVRPLCFLSHPHFWPLRKMDESWGSRDCYRLSQVGNSKYTWSSKCLCFIVANPHILWYIDYSFYVDNPFSPF